MKTLFSNALYALCLLACLTLASCPAQAQGQRMEGLKIAMLTQDLELSTEQAEKFWPIFNEYAAKRKTLHKQLRGLQDKLLAATAPEPELMAGVDEVLTLRQKELDLTREYLPKMKKILSAKQLGRLITLEKRMAKQLMSRRHGGQGTAPPPTGDGAD